MTLHLKLAPDPTAPATARETIQVLANMLAPQRLTDLELVLTELVTNAVEHGPGRPVAIKLMLDGKGGVRGEVTDRGDGARAVREADEQSLQGGIGLPVVERLSLRWGVFEGSTHVWFEL
jgi:anti-sigma regulatory factor (Ser/Thr protein kinase)